MYSLSKRHSGLTLSRLDLWVFEELDMRSLSRSLSCGNGCWDGVQPYRYVGVDAADSASRIVTPVFPRILLSITLRLGRDVCVPSFANDVEMALVISPRYHIC